jgi:hypothetical protein
MRAKPLAKSYDKLNPRERLQLVLAAHARQDAADVDRLLEACAMKTYRMRDASFGDAYEAVFRMNLAVLGDIGAKLAEFRMMERLLYAAPAFCVRAGFEIEQEAMFGDLETNEPAPEDELPPPPEDLPMPNPHKLSKGRELVDSYSEHRLPKTLRLIGRLREHISASIVAEVKGLLSGYDRFTRPVLGMGAIEALQATDPQIAEELAPLLAFPVEAKRQTTERVAAAAAKVWEQLNRR